MELCNQNTAAVPNGGNLPQEIITDLLSRLPVKTLCRFKCVSPSWKSLISDPYFAKTHLNQTNSLNTKNLHQKVIILCSCGNLYSLDLADVNLTTTKLDFPPVRTRVFSSYDGLLLVSHNDNSILLNPSTREHKVLPTLPFAIGLFPMRAYVIGYDSSTDDYKVAIISNYCPESESSTWRACTLVAVYSRKTNAWRRIQDTHHILVKRTGSAVFCNGCLHYFGRSWSTGSYGIVAFDLSDEIFQEVLPPASFTTYELSQYNMKVFGGRLCLFDQRNYQIGFWMMEEYGVRDSWTKFSIDMPKMSVELLCVLAKDELLLKTRQKVLDNRGEEEDNLVVYNFKNRRQRSMVHCHLPKFEFACAYVESLVSPNYGEGIEINE